MQNECIGKRQTAGDPAAPPPKRHGERTGRKFRVRVCGKKIIVIKDRSGCKLCFEQGVIQRRTRTGIAYRVTMKLRIMLPFVHIASGVYYSTDFDVFIAEQIAVFDTREGTVFCSRLEKRVFMRTATRNVGEGLIVKLCRHIHREICALEYGEEFVR